MARRTSQTSVAVLERFARHGLEVLVCTPHLAGVARGSRRTSDTIAILAETLVAAAPSKPELRLGWEIMLDRPGCDLCSPTLSLGGAKAVLVEFPAPYLPVARPTSSIASGAEASFRSLRTRSDTTAARSIPCAPGAMRERSFRPMRRCCSRADR